MKLSGWQLVWVIITTEIVAIFGLRISPAIDAAKQDAWLSMLLGGLIGAVLTSLAVHLSMLHPKQSLSRYSQALLGRWAGKIVVIPYLLAWCLFSAFILRSFVDFLHLVLVDKTPLLAILLLLLGVIIYMSSSAGITGIGRFCELFGPIILFVLVISFLFNIGNVNRHLLLPIFIDSGWRNIIEGSLAPAFWFPGPFTLLSMISFMKKPERALAKSLWGVGVNVFMSVIATLMVVLVFGPALSAKIRFSYFMFVRSIDIFNFVQNVDVFVMFIWIFGVTAQLALYLFLFSYESAQWFNATNWRGFVWLGAAVILALALLIPNETLIGRFDKFWTMVVFPVCGIGIPLLLWIITMVKRKRPPAST